MPPRVQAGRALRGQAGLLVAALFVMIEAVERVAIGPRWFLADGRGRKPLLWPSIHQELLRLLES